jgi:hypothetical protein
VTNLEGIIMTGQPTLTVQAHDHDTTNARDQWLARCTDDAATALATQNADLLPLLPEMVFAPASERCPDCRGTGYDYETFDLCYCTDRHRPAYDFLRYAKGEAPLSIIGIYLRTPNGEADVWKPCQHCDIDPIKHGPCKRGDLIRTPWVPDCTTCNDTGWAFSRHVPATSVFC